MATLLYHSLPDRHLLRTLPSVLSPPNVRYHLEKQKFNPTCIVWSRADSHDTETRRQNARKPPWSQEEDAKILRGHSAGKSVLELLDELPGRSREGIDRRWETIRVRIEPRTTLSMNNRRWTEADIKSVRELWNRNIACPDIASQLGRTVHGVRRAVSKLTGQQHSQLQTRNPRWQPDEIAALHSLSSEGETIPAIARRLGRSAKAVKMRRYTERRRTSVEVLSHLRPIQTKEMKRISALLHEGKTSLEMAEITSLDLEHISRIESRLSDPSLEDSGILRLPRRWSPAEVQKARELRAQGKTYKQIGYDLDRSVQAVRAQVRYTKNHTIPSKDEDV